MNRVLTLIICFFPFFACSNRQPEPEAATDTLTAIQSVQTISGDTFSKSIILPHIVCLADASQSYALYIPVAKSKLPLPLIYCFDPHGDGSLPLQQYKALADEFGFILIGSNNSKNGNDWNATQTIVTTLFNDVQNRIAFDHNRLYALGFSGGAKVAGYTALHQTGIKGIITAGAGLPDEETPRNFPFAITAMAGRGDMNMTNLIAMNATLNQTSSVHRLILFDGKHAWPPADVMRTAFIALQFDAMRNNTEPKSDSLISSYISLEKKHISNEEANHRWLEAEQTCDLAINLLVNLTNTGWFSKEQSAIKSNVAYVQQQQQTQQLLAQEEQAQQTFQQQFSQGDMNYWKTTIAGLQQKAKAATAEGAMNQRLLAYLSLAFYSISNRLITSNQNEAAQHFVALYKLADDTNAEAWYFSAVLNARNGNAGEAEKDLLKAVSLGFTDTARLHQQSEFQSQALHLPIKAIEDKMKK